MKKNLWKQALSVILCAALLTVLFCGCGGKEPQQSQTPASSAGGTQPEETGDKGPLYIEGSEGVTLTFWTPMEDIQTQHFTSLEEHPFYQWMEEQTGVHVEFIHPSREQMAQQLSLMISSGEYYDILYNPDYPGGPQTGIDLAPYLDEYMPDYKAAINCDDGSFSAWEWGEEKELYQPLPQSAFAENLYTSSGALWCVTQLWGDVLYPEFGPVIRKDWLDEAGLDVPETLEELEAVLKAFKERGGDVVPMNLGQEGYNTKDGSILSAFDLYAGFFTMTPDKKTVQPHAYTQDGFKEYLTLMNDWYGKGYIDPDFMNRDDEATVAMFLNDQLGIYFDNSSTPDFYMENYTGDQKFEVVAMPLPRKTRDQQLHHRNCYMPTPNEYKCVTTSCEHPEIAAQWLNVLFTKEGILRSSYGVEGEDYELRNGVPYFTSEALEIDREEFKFCKTAPLLGFYSQRADLMFEEGAEKQLSNFVQAGVTWQQNADADLAWSYVTFSDDGWSKFETPMNDAKTYADPMVLKFIIGEESLDKFEEFQKTAESLGLEQARAAAQEALDAM